MATLGPGPLGIIEQASRTNNGNTLRIVEAMSRVDQWMQALPWIEANGDATHKISRRSGLPAGQRRRLNQGITRSSSQTTPHNESMENIEDRSDIDITWLERQPDPMRARENEDRAFAQGIGQTLSDDFIYGNVTTDPDSMHGLAPRRASLSDTRVINAGGTGNDLSSIWVLRTGEEGCHMIYPRGSQVGIQFEDWGMQLVKDSSNNEYRAMTSWFQVQAGFAVADERSLWRIANVETSGSSNIFDPDDLIRILRLIRGGMGNTIILCNSTIAAQIDSAASTKSNVQHTMQDAFGMPVTLFQNRYPILICDAILNTESALT